MREDGNAAIDRFFVELFEVWKWELTLCCCCSLQRYLRNLFRVMLSSSGSPLRADADGGFHLSKHAICEFSPFFKKGVFESSSHGTGWLLTESAFCVPKVPSNQNETKKNCPVPFLRGLGSGESPQKFQRRKKTCRSVSSPTSRHPVGTTIPNLVRCCSALSPRGNFIMNVKVGSSSLCLKSFHFYIINPERRSTAFHRL